MWRGAAVPSVDEVVKEGFTDIVSGGKGGVVLHV
jgi:hypothetical protein